MFGSLYTSSFVCLVLSLAAAAHAADYSDASHRQQEFARAQALDAPYLAERCLAARAAAARTVTRTTTIRSGATTKFSTATKVSTVRTTTTLSGTTTSYKTTLPVKRSLATDIPSADFQKRAIVDEIFNQYERAAGSELHVACRAVAAATVTKVVTVRRPTATVSRVTTVKQITTQVVTKTVIRTIAAATRTPASAPKYVRCPDVTDLPEGAILPIPGAAVVAPTAGSDIFKASSYTLDCLTVFSFPGAGGALNFTSIDCLYDTVSGKLLRATDDAAPGACPKQVTSYSKVGTACDYVESCPYLPGRTLTYFRIGGGNALPVFPQPFQYALTCLYDSGRCQYDAGSTNLIGTNSAECPPTLAPNRLQGYCLA